MWNRILDGMVAAGIELLEMTFPPPIGSRRSRLTGLRGVPQELASRGLALKSGFHIALGLGRGHRPRSRPLTKQPPTPSSSATPAVTPWSWAADAP